MGESGERFHGIRSSEWTAEILAFKPTEIRKTKKVRHWQAISFHKQSPCKTSTVEGDDEFFSKLGGAWIVAAFTWRRGLDFKE